MQQDQVEIVERKLAEDRGNCFRGTACVSFEHLDFSSQPDLDGKNVKYLQEMFEIQGCLRLEPKHHIPAIIDQQTLDLAIKSSPGVSLNTLLDNPKKLPPKLTIPLNCTLECLRGRHRVQAARETLHPKDKWWTVDLYLKGISSDTKIALSEEYSNSANFSDGEIYQKIRQYRSYNTGSTETMFAEKRLWARLRKDKRRDLKKLLGHEGFTAAFDSLLVIPGIWGGLRIGMLRKLMAMKCDEELLHYLKHILRVWSAILGGNEALMRITDRATVEALELRAPGYSQEDLKALETRFRNGELFPAVRSPQDRRNIWSNLQGVEGLIPSVYTFFEDAKYLKPCATIMKRLFGKTKLTVYQAMCRIFTGCNQLDGEFILQDSKRSFRSVPGNLTDRIEFGYRQVFLYTWRHFTELNRECPRKEDGQDTPVSQEPDPKAWYDFAALANKLGFGSEQIKRLMSLDPDWEAARDALLKGREPRYYKYDEASFERFQSQIVSMYQKAVDIPSTYIKPPLLVDGPGESLQRRCGRIFQRAYENDRETLFLDVLYNPRAGEGKGVSSFYVRTSVYFAFFGRPHASGIGTVDENSSHNLGTEPQGSQGSGSQGGASQGDGQAVTESHSVQLPGAVGLLTAVPTSNSHQMAQVSTDKDTMDLMKCSDEFILYEGEYGGEQMQGVMSPDLKASRILVKLLRNNNYVNAYYLPHDKDVVTAAMRGAARKGYNIFDKDHRAVLPEKCCDAVTSVKDFKAGDTKTLLLERESGIGVDRVPSKSGVHKSRKRKTPISPTPPFTEKSLTKQS